MKNGTKSPFLPSGTTAIMRFLPDFCFTALFSACGQFLLQYTRIVGFAGFARFKARFSRVLPVLTAYTRAGKWITFPGFLPGNVPFGCSPYGDVCTPKVQMRFYRSIARAQRDVFRTNLFERMIGILIYSIREDSKSAITGKYHRKKLAPVLLPVQSPEKKAIFHFAGNRIPIK
jgi:hypothetical protein